MICDSYAWLHVPLIYTLHIARKLDNQSSKTPTSQPNRNQNITAVVGEHFAVVFYYNEAEYN